MKPTVKQVLSEIFGLESSWLDNYQRRMKLDVAFLTKPQVGTRFKTDFATLTVGQGGSVINLIEKMENKSLLQTNFPAEFSV